MRRASPRSRPAVTGLLLVALCLAAAAGTVRANNQPKPILPPAGKFTFRIQWDGRYVIGVTHVSPLIRSTEVVEPRSGDDPNGVMKSPGFTDYEPIVIERRLTNDKEFEQWANKVWNYGSGFGAEASLADFRKDIRIELYNDAGALAMVWKVYRCWPSEYIVIGEMSAEKPVAPVEVLVIEHEGWERDRSIGSP